MNDQAEHHLWVEYREQRIEVTASRRSKKSSDHCALGGRIGVLRHCSSSHQAARVVRDLPGRWDFPVQNGSNLLEGHGEDVVQHEGKALGGRVCVENHERNITAFILLGLLIKLHPSLFCDPFARFLRMIHSAMARLITQLAPISHSWVCWPGVPKISTQISPVSACVPAPWPRA